MKKHPQVDEHYLPKDEIDRDMHRRLFDGMELDTEGESFLHAAWVPYLDRQSTPVDRLKEFRERVYRKLEMPDRIEKKALGPIYAMAAAEVIKEFEKLFLEIRMWRENDTRHQQELRRDAWWERIKEIILETTQQYDLLNESNIQAATFKIMTLFYGECDDQVRALAESQRAFTGTWKESESSSRERMHKWIALRSLLRTGVFGALAVTAYWGIKAGLTLRSNMLDYENNPVAETVGAFIGGMAIAEVLNTAKVRIEACGLQQNQPTLRGALGTTIREYPLSTTGVAGVMAIGLGVSVYGVIDQSLKTQDVARQISALQEEVNDYQEQVDRVWENQREGSVMRQATIDAHTVLIDEAIGAQSGMPGIGPRGYGVLAGYFGNQSVEFYEGERARELYANLSDSSDENLKIYRGWRIGDVSGGGVTWSAAGILQPLDKSVGWTIGWFPTEKHAMDHLEARKRDEGGRYIEAWEVVQDFRRTHGYSDGYATAMDRRRKTYWSDVQNMSDAHFDYVRAEINKWDPRDGAIVLLNNGGVITELLNEDLPTRRNEMTLAALNDMNKIGENFDTFDEDLENVLGNTRPIRDIMVPDLLDYELSEFKPDTVDMSAMGAPGVFENTRLSQEKAMVRSILSTILLFLIILNCADLMLYPRIYKAHKEDLERAQQEFDEVKGTVNRLLRTLHDYFNHGPLSELYRGNASEKGTTEVVLTKEILFYRMARVLALKTEAARIPLVEAGGVSGTLRSLGRWARAPHKIRSDLMAFARAYLGRSSAASRAHHRLVEAAEGLFKEPDLLQSHFLTFNYRGMGRVHPGDLAYHVAMSRQRRPKVGEDMGVWLNEEIKRILSDVLSGPKQRADSTKTQPQIRKLLKKMPELGWKREDPMKWVTVGEWLSQVDALEDSDALSRKDRDDFNIVKRRARDIRKALERHMERFEKVLESGRAHLQAEPLPAVNHYPEEFHGTFKGIEDRLKQTFVPPRSVSDSDELNEVLKRFDQRIQELKSAKASLEKFNLESGSYSRWKDRLLRNTEEQIAELEAWKERYEQTNRTNITESNR